MGAAIASVLRANSGHDFQIFVCSERRDREAEEKLSATVSRFGNASIAFLEFNLSKHGHLRVDRYLSIAAYMRLFVAEFLDPQVEKILYLDSDLVVSGDIGELWQTDLHGAFLAAVPEPYLVTSHWGFGPADTYFNSGVLLIDVAQWRSENLLPAFLKFAEEHAADLNCHDQDVLNHVCRGKVEFLDYRWNFQSRFAFFPAELFGMSPKTFREVRRMPKIVHFTTKYKPWIYEYEPHYKRLYTEALSLTPWKDSRAADRTPREFLRRLVRMKYLKERLAWYAPRTAFLREMASRRGHTE
jgi:lipopolysaccharide biosynthesis glycosyltransferase